MQPKAVGLVLVAVTLLAGCDAPVKVAGSSINPTGLGIHPDAIVYLTNNRDVPFDITLSNPCNGDVLNVTGSSHFVIQTAFDSNAKFHYISNTVTQGTGVGVPSGVSYVINEHFKYMEQVPGDVASALVIHQSDDWLVNAPKTENDFTLSQGFKITVDANGNPTATTENNSVRCGA